jgi:hypothetical protein
LWGRSTVQTTFYNRTALPPCSPLAYPGAAETTVTGINNSGRVVGWYVDSHSILHGFAYDGRTYTTLDDGFGTTLLFAINNNGHIVASSVLHSLFIYDGSVFTSQPGLASLNGTTSEVDIKGINNNDVIVGTVTPSTGGSYGFIINGTDFSPIVVPGATSTAVMGINDDGVVLVQGDGNVYLYRAGSFTLIVGVADSGPVTGAVYGRGNMVSSRGTRDWQGGGCGFSTCIWFTVPRW